MAFLVLGANSVSGYTVKNSLRFNSGSSDYLNRTPASAGNRQIFTISLWVKISGSTSRQVLFWTPTSSSTFAFFDSGELRFGAGDGASWYYVPTQLFRDPSAWYHLVFAVDTTQATASNRVKLYVNGSQITSFSSTTNPTQNFSSAWNNNAIHYIGAGYDGGLTYYYGGYMSEIYNIDGQQLTPSSFGETDTDTGIWKPKAYTGTYGTNGFYLKFANSASLGTDSSGNGNTFTVNNLTSVDQSTDTPTNNFSTMNPLRQPTGYPATLTNGNLTVSTSTSTPAYYGAKSTIGVNSGKWYFEAKLVSQTATTALVGIQNTEDYTPELFNGGTGAFAGYSSTGWSYFAGGVYVNNSTDISYGNSYTTGDIISVALDCDNSKLYFAKNGTYQNSGVPTSGATGTGAISITSALTYLFSVDDGGSNQSCVWDCNFGSPPYTGGSYTDGAGYGNFSYAVPSGYYSLNTKNLATFG